MDVVFEEAFLSLFLVYSHKVFAGYFSSSSSSDWTTCLALDRLPPPSYYLFLKRAAAPVSWELSKVLSSLDFDLPAEIVSQVPWAVEGSVVATCLLIAFSVLGSDKFFLELD
jgi:hypothetical protein